MTFRSVPRLLPISFIAGVLAVTALLGWPRWMWFPLTAAVAGALLLDMKVRSGAGRAVAPEEPQGSEFPVEPPYLESPVIDVPVASSLDAYPLLFSATVRWRRETDLLTASHGNPGALAVASVLRRVEVYTRAEHPSRAEFLCRWLEGLLGQPVQDESGTVTAYATDLRLHLRQEDRHHLEELEEHRRDIGAWERKREYERNRREYFGEDVLRSPGSAVVWWLSRHEDEIERATELIGSLSCLSAVANDQEVPDAYRHLVGDQASPADAEPPNGFGHPQDADTATDRPAQDVRPPTGRPQARPASVITALDTMGIPRDPEERAVFVHRLARMMEASGRPEAADHLRGVLVDETAPEGAECGPEPDEPAPPRPTEPGEQLRQRPDGNQGLEAPWWPPRSPSSDATAARPGDPHGSPPTEERKP